ncbi:MAG: T9SS type A sorting domain-containing protein [Polaribacter sp.]|nr:T9SS type A sorting domain-containing protein [Polaribacter sp.]
MKKSIFFTAVFFLIFQGISSQVTLIANGSGDTYELINAALANPGRDVVEVPDCGHTSFGRHIDEIFDAELNKNVFQFYAHVDQDNDRCQNFDRQRTEIKTYDGSPENLKANIAETVVYKWKFKLSDTFKASSNFTHIHQIKSVGGAYESIPMITLTLRKSSPDRVELRYAPMLSQSTLKTAELDLFRGNWVEVYEKITFGDSGSYQIEIKNIASGQVIFEYTNNAIDMWQDGAGFARPKWGIYRSLINKQDLQDEIVKFADFSIEEITGSLSVDDLKKKADKIVLYPNPASKEITFENANSENYDTVKFYDNVGREIVIKQEVYQNKLNVSQLSKGLYFVVFKKDTITTKVLKFVVK